ncbi:hypothetical protein HYV50_01605 [Candidatus Pacearchaeota archaeon]|nr:hypothetical protein [Candidatus Pacearchaeota archaeon]
MFFNRRNQQKCENCGDRVEIRFNFCPNCGNSFVDSKKEQKDYGLLGRSDAVDAEQSSFPMQGFGIMDKMVNSLFNSLAKTLDKQFRGEIEDVENEFDKAEIINFPNGVKIKISGPFIQQRPKKKTQQKATNQITQEQINRMSSLPRKEAKTTVKRLGNKVIYELNAAGISSLDDVFFSKLESGYEIKAIGDKKVYVNTIPVNLPIRKYSIAKDKLFVEFAGH